MAKAELSGAVIDEHTELDEKWRLVWGIVNERGKVVRLAGANLRDAALAGVTLEGANLKGADLSGANLRYAILTGADMTDILLQRADLYEADLQGANLAGADLSDVQGLTKEQLESAKTYKAAKLPDYLSR